MEPLPISRRVIGAAIEVHKHLGPGLLVSTYRACLSEELSNRGIAHKTEAPIVIHYRAKELDCGFRADLLVADELIVELHSEPELNPLHKAKLLTYMKLSGVESGLLINFDVARLVDGLHSLSGLNDRTPAISVFT